jgi:hypothetical protein
MEEVELDAEHVVEGIASLVDVVVTATTTVKLT